MRVTSALGRLQAAMVDLPTEKQRRKAAIKLAGRKEFDLHRGGAH